MDAPKPLLEDARIKALHDLKILDTPPEERFDRITKIAQIIFDVPIALVSLVDTNRQWFKSCAGLSARETPRSMSFCAHAILDKDVLAIEDATQDKRFADNPLVTGEPFIRFYAGKPIAGPDSQVLGTLCIIDRKPRKMSRADRMVLSDLANWVENEFRTILLTNQLKEANEKLALYQQELEDKNVNLQNEVNQKTQELLKRSRLADIGLLASRLAHDLRNPLSIIKTTIDILKLSTKNEPDKQKRFEIIDRAIEKINHNFDQVLDFVRVVPPSLTIVQVASILNNSIKSLAVPAGIKIDVAPSNIMVKCDSKQIEIAIINLLLNAIQSLENNGQINIRVLEKPDGIHIEIEDSGLGVPDDLMDKIFDPLFTTKQTGTGLGLVSVKNIIDQHGGKIKVKNNPSTFTIILPKSA